MNEEKRKFSPPAVGGSSLLVIFAVLCLTIFALLSMSTVQADGRLANAANDAITGYYAADTQAEEILARLRNGEVPEGVTLSENGELTAATYVCTISKSQQLAVAVIFHGGLGDDYEIRTWQSVSTANWDPDQHLNVWDGT